MKLLILAAGYATRLQPLTLHQPKSLLAVAGKPMVNWVLDHVASFGGLDRVLLVTNDKFAGHFQRWAADYRGDPQLPEITILNDGSTDETNRLGAIGDLGFVLEQERVDDDLIVVAGDNLFSESLDDFGRCIHGSSTPVVGVYDVGSLDEAKKYGVVSLDAAGRLTAFEEKPAKPAGTLIAIALYYYPRTTLPLIRQYLAEGHNADQPGRLVQWMYQRVPFHTWRVPGEWYDIGSHETLEEANRIFTGLAR